MSVWRGGSFEVEVVPSIVALEGFAVAAVVAVVYFVAVFVVAEVVVAIAVAAQLHLPV